MIAQLLLSTTLKWRGAQHWHAAMQPSYCDMFPGQNPLRERRISTSADSPVIVAERRSISEIGSARPAECSQRSQASIGMLHLYRDRRKRNVQPCSAVFASQLAPSELGRTCSKLVVDRSGLPLRPYGRRFCTYERRLIALSGLRLRKLYL